MKKVLALLLLAAIVVPAFADDALMLPQGVWRIRVIPSVTFNSKIFDDDGERQDIGAYDAAQIYNLSGAIEYGVNDWITAAAQWTPGWRIGTNFDNPTPDTLKSKGLNDLFLGGKFQILGENAPVPNDQMRLAAAAGVLVPLTTWDAETEAEAAVKGDDFVQSRVDNDAWGLGWRLYYDYVVNGNFFVNLYNEFIYFLPTDQADFDAWTQYYGAVAQGVAAPEPGDLEVEYGYDLTFELEPQYTQMIGDGLEFGASLPFTFKSSPETKVEGTGLENESYTFSIGPSVNFFFQSTPWPIDLELQYQTPLMGKNALVTNTVVLQIKNYLKFW